MNGSAGVPGAGLTVGLLGALEVTRGGHPVVTTTGRLRTVLAVLAMSAGTAVSVGRIADAVWGDELPNNARRSVQTYMTRLRALLGADAIGTTSAGYLLRVDPDDVDAVRFVRLLDAAAVADASAEHALLTEALALWRGDPFPDVPSAWLAQAEGARLVERYLGAVERRIDLDIAAGRADRLPAELRRLTAEHPLRESLWARLLTVLDRCGQRAEALRQYEIVRVRIADELGVAVGAELQQVYTDLLADPAPQPAAHTFTAPRHLPAGADGFIGRHATLTSLQDLLRSRSRSPVAVIAGPAGVGKTTVALHWAHQVADRFPDGQLYVNLRGFDPGGSPMTVAEAVRGLLDALGVVPQRIPTEVAAQLGLYRSLLADRRVLVLLDNARDTAQVRSLLPAAPGCLALVTSRSQLTGLVAAAGARPVALGVLSTDEARDLLARRLGTARVAAEPAAVAEIIARCARLPLALAVVAARAAIHPRFPLETFAAQLRDACSGLDALSVADVATDVRAVFSWSYRTLSPPAARLFRLLGLHPGPDIGLPAAASLASVPPRDVGPRLAELCRAHLLTEHVPGRYTFHDLLRTYAAELVTSDEAAADRRAATLRMCDHYLHTACAADRMLFPHRHPVTLAAATPGVGPEWIRDYQQALTWFTVEHPVLVAVIEAAAGRFDRHAWQLAWSMVTFFFRRGYWHDWSATQRVALDAAGRLADPAAQAFAHRELGLVHTRLGRVAEAQDHYLRALELFDGVGDDAGRAHTHLNLGYACEQRRDFDGALRHAREALRLYEVTGNQAGRAAALNNVGWYCGGLGDHRQALTYCRQALAVHTEIGNPTGQASAWDSIGHAHHHLGEYADAAACYRRAHDLYRDLDDRYNWADVLAHLGHTHHAAGDLPAARDAWRQALAIFDELGHPAADDIRATLRGAD